MSKFLTLFTTLFITVTLSSCGVKRNSKEDFQSTTAYVNALLSSKSCREEISSELEGEIQKLENLLMNVEVVGSKHSGRRKKRARSIKLEKKVLSEGLIKKRLSSLEQEINLGLETGVLSHEYRKVREEVQRLRIDFDRWSFHQCHLPDLIDNDDQEITDFIELESSICEKDCENSLMSGIMLSDLERRERTISVCSLFHRINFCRVQYDMSVIYNNENEFVRETLRKAKDYFNQKVFGIQDSPLEIECVVKEKKEITIPIFQNENSASLINAISENWKSDDVEIRYKLGNSGVRLELVDSGLSRVQLDNLSTIYLNKDISGIERVKTIAHEFGHSLGFKDCYIEYFDSKSEEIVYYELEREKGNLMCSLEYGTNIPKKYLEKVVSKYCK